MERLITMTKPFFVLISLLALAPVYASENPLAALFDDYNFESTFIISHLNNGTSYTYNQPRSLRPLTVASTFKILNTLIALEEGIINKDTHFKWNGTQHSIKNWNQDQSLASAFAYSCVWCYQSIAQKIGIARYRYYLKSFIDVDLPKTAAPTHFWLDGTLKISAVNQINMLKKIYKNNTLFNQKNYAILKDIMQDNSPSQFNLFAKTGWAPNGEHPSGWYVGYIETKNDVWFFATNLAITDMSQLSLRKELTLKAIKRLKITP